MTSEDRTLNVKRVNNISSRPLHATAEELLSRGPKFSITPSVNSSLLRDVERNFEGFAYGKRWTDKILNDREERANRDIQNDHGHPTGGEDGDRDADGHASRASGTSALEGGAGCQSTADGGRLFTGIRFPDINKRQPPLTSKDSEEQLSNLKSSIIKIYKCHQNSAPNASREERDALKTLREDDSLTIKPSDKCKGFVIMDKQDYIDKAKTINSQGSG